MKTVLKLHTQNISVETIITTQKLVPKLNHNIIFEIIEKTGKLKKLIGI